MTNKKASIAGFFIYTFKKSIIQDPLSMDPF